MTGQHQKRNLSRIKGNVAKEVSNSGKDSFKRAEAALFFMLRMQESDRESGGKQGENQLQKCLQVKARHQTCRANPSNPRSAGIFPAPRLASKTEGCHQAGHLSKGRNENVLRK